MAQASVGVRLGKIMIGPHHLSVGETFLPEPPARADEIQRTYNAQEHVEPQTALVLLQHTAGVSGQVRRGCYDSTVVSYLSYTRSALKTPMIT
jgi:hypothetical protein